MTDPQPLTPQRLTPVVREARQRETIDVLEGISHLMDRCFTIPGTNFRWGLNSLLLLLPGVGDVLAAAISTYVLVAGLKHYRVPRIVAARMILTAVLDTALSALPLVGNLWDVWFKADTRNVTLLRQYATISNDPPPSAWSHWAFVGGLLLLCIAVFALAAYAGAALFSVFSRGLRTPQIAD